MKVVPMIIRSMHKKYQLPTRRLVVLNVLYFLPDQRNLVNEFIYQTEDEIPCLPRIHRFLTYWQHHIEAVIKDVSVCNAGNAIATWRHGSLITA